MLHQTMKLCMYTYLVLYKFHHLNKLIHKQVSCKWHQPMKLYTCTYSVPYRFHYFGKERHIQVLYNEFQSMLTDKYKCRDLNMYHHLNMQEYRRVSRT